MFNIFKKKKEDLPSSFIFNDKHKVTVFRSWDEVPFSVYLKYLDAKTTEEKLMLLSTASSEALKDSFIRQSVENMTIFSVAEPQRTDQLSIILDQTYYDFDKDIEVLKHSYDQLQYANGHLKLVYDLVSKMHIENQKDEPDPLLIADVTKQSNDNIIRSYPNLIASYCNVAHGEDFNYDKVEGYYLPLIKELKTTSVITLGYFFLKKLEELKNGKQTSKTKHK